MNNNFEILNEFNFKNFCIKFHKDSFLTEDILKEDLKIVSYLKKSLQKFKNNKKINIGIVFNYIFIIYNIWGDAALPILIYKIPESNLDCLKTLLKFLNKWPENETEDLKKIPINQKFIELIKKETNKSIQEII
ncbi:MAG: hypothetical protein ABIL47_07535 [candidate division WOR-3 bacterium]